MVSEFKKSGVFIKCVPESNETYEIRGHSLLRPEVTFSLTTDGMRRTFDLPEFQMTGVPGLYQWEAFSILNHWGHYFSEGAPFKDGDMLSHQPHPDAPNPLMRLRKVNDDLWQIEYAGIQHECEMCARGETH